MVLVICIPVKHFINFHNVRINFICVKLIASSVKAKNKAFGRICLYRLLFLWSRQSATFISHGEFWIVLWKGMQSQRHRISGANNVNVLQRIPEDHKNSLTFSPSCRAEARIDPVAWWTGYTSRGTNQNAPAEQLKTNYAVCSTFSSPSWNQCSYVPCGRRSRRPVMVIPCAHNASCWVCIGKLDSSTSILPIRWN